MSKTPLDFYQQYNGQTIDYDKAYGAQCVDGFRVFCSWAGIPSFATPNNWADGYWIYRDRLGYNAYFDYIYDYHEFKDGDWVIWGRVSSHPSTHIAMYYQGMEFGENQDKTFKGFKLKGTIFTDAHGALRWKGWTNSMNIERGYHNLNYNGIDVNIVRASAASGFKLHYISAEDNPNVGLSFARKGIMDFDRDDLAIVAAVNANYFQMSDGMHLGCEGDGYTGGYFQAPKAAGIVSYYITKSGEIGAHDQSSFYLGLDDIQMVCAPYEILISGNKSVYLRSESFGNKDLVKNTQTAAMRIGEDWCLAIFSECFPSDVHKFALDCNANELILMDSGGSTQMFECATTGKRRSVRNTGRLISGVLVLAKEITATKPIDEPEPIVTPEPTTEEPEPVEEPTEPEPTTENPQEKEEAKGIFGMTNKVYDILKYVAQIVLPAAATLIVALGELWGIQNVKQIAGTIIAIDTFLGALLQISTNVYKKNKGIDDD